MTTRERIVIRILLLVARLIAPEAMAAEVKTLENHMSFELPKAEV